MKKLLIVFLLLIWPCILTADLSPYVAGSGTPAGGGSTLDWTDCVLFVTFEAGDNTGAYDISTTNGDYSAGDTSMAYNESAALESTNEIVGSYSGYINGYGWFELAVSSGDLGPGSSGAVGFWINISTWADGTETFGYSGGSDIFKFAMNGTDEWRWMEFDSSDYQFWTTTDANTGTGTDYFIEFIWDSGALEVYVNNTLKSNNDPGSWGSFTGFTGLQIGDPQNNGATFVIDQIMIFDDVANLTDGRLWGYRNAAYND